MDLIYWIPLTIHFVWCPPCATLHSHCFEIHYALLLPHFRLSYCYIVLWTPFGTIFMYSKSSQQQLSNKSRNDPGGALIVLLCARLQVFTLSSLFCLFLRLHSTSLDMNLISGIPLTICFVWSLSCAPKCARCFRIHHVLFLPHFNLLSHCITPWTLFSVIHISPKISEWVFSNEPMCDPRDTLVVPLCAGFWCWCYPPVVVTISKITIICYEIYIN